MDALTGETREPRKPGDNQRSTFQSSLRSFFIHRHFAFLWIGRAVSNFGSYITGIGLPVAALLLLHATPAQMGLLAALEALPGLFLGLFIGVLVDRLPRRPIMIAADIGRALLLALIPLTVALGLLQLDWFYVVAVLVGVLTICFDVAGLSFLPTLLQLEDLPVGNSRLGTSDSLAEIAGPPMAGLLISLLTAPVAILLDVLSFLFSAFCLSRICVSETRREDSTARLHLWGEIGEGLSLLLRSPILRSLAAYISTQMFFGGAFAALYLLYTMQLFGASPLAYSILVALGGIGALGGSFCASRFTRHFGYGRTLIGMSLLFGLLSFCTPLAAGPLPVAFVLMAVSQLFGDTAFAVYSINEISLRQELIPIHLLGRVNACMHILSNSVMPLGALLAGLLAEVIGVRHTLLVASSGIFLAFAWLLFSPLRHYR